jgi:hypothetical protein
MKKFSVLLVIIVLSVPLIVYGVYGLVGNNNPSKLSIPDEPNSVIKTLDEPVPSSENDMQKLPNPFIQVMPPGIKGKVSDINLLSKTIRLTDAHYFNPITQKDEVSDFMIYFNNDTKFVKDLEFETDVNGISAVSIGEMIVCQGQENFEKKEVKYATTVFLGRLLPKDFVASVSCGGFIENLDRENKTFVLDFSMYEGLSKIIVQIGEGTKCFTEKVGVENSIKEIGRGVIPEFVDNGAEVGITIRLKEGVNKGYAEVADFIEH